MKTAVDQLIEKMSLEDVCKYSNELAEAKEMEKEFIPYELALRMKQLRYDGSCFAMWSGFDEQNFSVTDMVRLYSSGFRINGTQSSKFYVNDFNSLRVAAPTYSQAFRWFREKYNLDSYLKPQIITGKKSYDFYIWINDNEYLEIGVSNTATYEEADLVCLEKLIEIIEQKQKEKEAKKSCKQFKKK
jgi:hypothetical protein